jgi:1-pyrroline-5-carboxylate dehydrogenase
MMVPEFVNEPLTDFGSEPAQRAFKAALARVEAERDREWPLVIGGERVITGEWIVSMNPAQKGEVIGRVASGGTAEAERALEAAWRAYPDWSRTPADDRARVLLRAAAIMRRRKHDFSATMVLEIGKTWVEADADTAEAIDFLEYNARQMLRLAASQSVITVAGSAVELFWHSMGVCLAIPPWNFPVAIALNLAAAPIVAGNTVILKPSSLTPVAAARVVELFEEAGLPPGVLNFLPGPGSAVGNHLVRHPRVRLVNFTGSLEVGVHINQEAAKVPPGQRWLKRVIAEMGGKDAILVDDSWPDVEAAASGVVASAFGFQGQKCSACSRLIATEGVYEPLLARVAALTAALKTGDPRERATQIGPVADHNQFAKVTTFQDIGREEGRLVVGGGSDDTVGTYVEPTVFADVKPDARIAQEEIFGPVLAVIPARDFEHALEITNSTQYGLTGSVYSRDPAKLRRARDEFRAGVLYVNRKCTGARVGVEPFGGYDMSGTNSKAGGPDYLQHFMELKVVSEQL